MFHRWLSNQQPLWLIATLFLIGVLFEIQAPYYTPSDTTQKPPQNDARHSRVLLNLDRGTTPETQNRQ